MVMAHFVKRELETLLFVSFGVQVALLTFLDSVHRFSHSTMPFHNVFKKYATCVPLTSLISISRSSAHYHIGSGMFVQVILVFFKLKMPPRFSTRVVNLQTSVRLTSRRRNDP